MVGNLRVKSLEKVLGFRMKGPVKGGYVTKGLGSRIEGLGFRGG